MNLLDILLNAVLYAVFIVLAWVAIDNRGRLNEIKEYFVKKAEENENGEKEDESATNKKKKRRKNNNL